MDKYKTKSEMWFNVGDNNNVEMCFNVGGNVHQQCRS